MFEALVWLAPIAVLGAGLRGSGRAALVALAALLPLFGTSRGGPYQGAFDVACFLAIVIVGIRERRPAARSGLDAAVLLFVAVAIASFFPLAYEPPSWRPSVLLRLVPSLSQAQSWSVLFTWRALLDLLLGWGLYTAARRAFAHRSARPLAQGLAAGLLVTILVGLLEHAGLLDLSRYRIAMYEGRMHSFFFNPGWLSLYVVGALPFAAASLLAEAGLVGIVGHALVPLAMAAVLLTRARAGWGIVPAQGMASLLVLPARLRNQPEIRRTLRAVVGGTVLLVALALVVRPDIVSDMAARFNEYGVGLRVYLWEAAARMFALKPVLGWGIGAYQAALLKLYAISGAQEVVHGEAHNTLLHIAAERGALGVASLMLLLFAAFVTVRSELRRPDTDPWIAAGRALSLVGILLYSLLQYVWHVPPVGALLWLLLGSCPTPEGSRVDAFLGRRAPWLAALALVLVPWQIFRATPLDAAGSRSYGFHRVEASAARPFEWTEGRAARRLPCSGPVLVLEIGNGQPKPAQRPVHVRIALDHHPVAELDVTGDFQALRLPARGPCTDGWVILELDATPTVRPFSDPRNDTPEGPSPDERELGAAVRGIRFEHR